jgi:hypothetical protein
VKPHRAGGDFAEHFEHLAHNPQCSLSHEKKGLTNMTRKLFIESHGATCKNWNWSWSFINKSERLIIFGAWVQFEDSRGAIIFPSSDFIMGKDPVFRRRTGSESGSYRSCGTRGRWI